MSVTLRTVIATRADAGRRLDLVLRRRLADLRTATRARVQAWMRAGAVVVNGRSVVRPAARAAQGDVILISMPDLPVRDPIRAEAVPLELLFQDDYMLAVNKPPGVVVHPTYRHPAGTLMNSLLWEARHWPAPQRPSLVGRLDKLTSGIVLVAKTRPVHAALQRALATSAAQKDYLAVVYGRVTAARGSIDLRLARDSRDRRRVVASATQGVPSLTRFERLARTDAPLALLRCRLITGRTHQIRVHLAARGWPIVGDAVYGEPGWPRIPDAALAAALQAFPRQALHAWRLAFPHPLTGAAVRIEAPIPSDLAGLLRAALLTGPTPTL